MKIKNIIKLSIMLLIIVMGVLLSGNKVLAARDRTNVILLQDDTNKDIVHIYLGMKEGSSIASFQIGLKIEGEADLTFTLDNKLNSDNLEYRYSKENETLNIYYVGSSELNSGVADDKIEVGTIKCNTDKTKNVSIKMTPVAELTTASSIGNSETEIDVKPEDTLSMVVEKETTPGGSETPGGEENPGNTPGDNPSDNPGDTPGENPGDNPSDDPENNPGGNENQGGQNTPGEGDNSGGNTSGTQGESSGNGSGTNGKNDKEQESNEFKGKLPQTGNPVIVEVLLGLAIILVIIPLTVITYRKLKK